MQVLCHFCINQPAPSSFLGTDTMRTIGALVLCTALLLLSTQQAAGLSYELCNSYGAEFVTDSPHLSGLYPFYSLIFMCNGEPHRCAPALHPPSLLLQALARTGLAVSRFLV